MMEKGFSVIMPTYNQATFIRRAVLSLQQQTFPDWELIIINDGCTDDTELYLKDFLSDSRISYVKNENNQGLGYAINQGLELAKREYIAYLPSDDFYYENHLESIYQKFQASPEFVLVFSGMKFDTNDTLYHSQVTESTKGKNGYCLQLVQTAHKNMGERWVERNEWISEDLFIMYWRKLTGHGVFGMTGKISCYWTSHPRQRHKITGEKYGGGLNQYRSAYHVQTPVKMKVSKEKFIDEESLYRNFRQEMPDDRNTLKIVLVGELAYNPERIYALEQAGHKLYGLWMQKPSFCFSTVGPLPFGHVKDIDVEHWKEEIEQIQPDIIYGLLNFGAVPLAYEVLRAFPKIPFAWHFKEGPSVSLRMGDWEKLIYLYTYATVRIFLNKTVQQWFELFIPSGGLSFIMDGDLPKVDYFKDCFSSKLSDLDNAIHTVVAGRMIGIADKELQTLAENNVHIHLYTENYHISRQTQLMHYKRIAPNHFHTHPHCAAPDWTKEFSQYDAGWLHCTESYNNGNLLKASWDDLNIPARISTYATAGLPLITRKTSGHIVATQECIQELNIGVLFDDYTDLCTQLKDKERMAVLRQSMKRHRKKFSFDYYVPELIEIFRKAIILKKQENNGYTN